MKKKYLLYIILPVMVFATLGSVAMSASAASEQNTHHPMANLVNAIAQKFNLNPTDVQKVFDDQKTQMYAEMEQKLSDRITKAVADGKLTQDQANKITAKIAELEAFKASLQGKTKEEVKTAMKAKMDSLKQWVKDNNIPMSYLNFGLHFGKMHHGFGHE